MMKNITLDDWLNKIENHWFSISIKIGGRF